MAALLSAVWPGLGQLTLGARRAGWLLAAPPLLMVALIVLALLTQDRLKLLAVFLDPAVIAALLVAQLALLAWRLAAVGDAFRRGLGPARERGSALTALALVFVLVPSAYLAYLTEVAREAAAAVFAPVEEPWVPTVIVPTNNDPDFGVLPSVGPTASPGPELGRYTVLLIGTDSGAGRTWSLTDTMIVASLDPISGAVSMVSVPRDLVDLPLPDGRIYRPKVNSLVSYASRFPGKFPGAASGEAVLAAGLGKLLGVRIDGWAEVNLPGFVNVVDAIGGVDITVRKAICDAGYQEYGFNGFAITPGRYHFNGLTALAYARIRKAAGENDFTRAARQGEIVVAARDRVLKGAFLADPAGFIDAMGKLVKTSVDPATIVEYLPAAMGITRDRMFRAVITYPLVHGAANDPRGSILVPRLDLIRELGKQAFPAAGTLPTGLETIPEDDPDAPTKTKLAKVTCYAAPDPTATPTLAPTAKPTTGPTAEPTQPPATSDPAPTDKPGGKPTPDPTLQPEPTAGP